MSAEFAGELEERLTRYCRIDTQADESSPPSTEKQFDRLNPLVEELREVGAQDVMLAEYGAVPASIPAAATGPAAAPHDASGG